MAALRLLLLPCAVAALASAADTQAHAGVAAEPSLLMLLQQRSEAVADGGHDHGLGRDHDHDGHDHGHREDAAAHQASLGTSARRAGHRKQAGHAALLMVGLVVLVFSLSTCQCLWDTPKEVASKAPSSKAPGDFVRRPLRSPTAAIPGRSASATSMPKVSSQEQIARSSSQPTVTGGPPRRKSDSA
jgi:hypothetical protein